MQRINEINAKQETKSELCKALSKLHQENSYEFFPIFSAENREIIANINQSQLLDYYVADIYQKHYRRKDDFIKDKIIRYLGNEYQALVVYQPIITMRDEYAKCLDISKDGVSLDLRPSTPYNASSYFDHKKFDPESGDYYYRQKHHKDLGPLHYVAIIAAFVGKSTCFFSYDSELYQENGYEAYIKNHSYSSKPPSINTILAEAKEKSGDYQEIPLGYASAFIGGVAGASAF
jgi:hypothetical protein